MVRLLYMWVDDLNFIYLVHATSQEEAKEKLLKKYNHNDHAVKLVEREPNCILRVEKVEVLY